MSEKTIKARPLLCRVTSDKMDKSRVGAVERLVKHERYGKYIRQTTKVMFHDEENKSKMGDEVLVEVTRPYSARKKFKLKEIIRAASE